MPRTRLSAPAADAPSGPAAARPKLLFLVTEDWVFCGGRMPMARAARAAGFDIVVATRVNAHGERIRAEGFALRPLSWRRRGDGLLGGCRAIGEIARVYRAERPDLVYHAGLKAIVFGAAAARLAFPLGRRGPARVAAVMGLGSVFPRVAAGRCGRFHPLVVAVRLAMRRGRVTVENPDDRAVLVRLGVDPGRIAVIRGPGVDAARYAPLPEPPGAALTVALVSRMLKSKGVPEAAAAVRRLRAQGCAVELVLAGQPDPANDDSLDEAELRRLAAEPGIEWLGPVADVRTVWQRAGLAVYPSTYGEGVPASLLEAAACARPIVAADMPGAREVVRPGETGLLVPPGDVERLAAAIAELARDPARRRAMGAAARDLILRGFTDERVGRETVAVYRAALAERDGAL